MRGSLASSLSDKASLRASGPADRDGGFDFGTKRGRERKSGVLNEANANANTTCGPLWSYFRFMSIEAFMMNSADSQTPTSCPTLGESLLFHTIISTFSLA